MKNAFTLAEVLIVLMVIGVVFALTVPTIIKHQHIKPTTQPKTCEYVCR